MEQTYRITIFTTESVIERYFYRRKIAIEAIVEFKKQFDDFIMGVLSKKIEKKWYCVYSIS